MPLINKQKVFAKIKDQIINDAVVYKNTLYENDYFICHNNQYCSGSQSPDLLGYKYSWCFHEINNGKKYFNEGVQIFPYELRETFLSEDLELFFLLEEINLIKLFELNKGRFLPYNKVSVNNNLLLLSNDKTNRKLEIKIGRFFRALIDDNLDLKELPNYLYINWDINNNDLENISNKFLNFINQDSTKLEIVKGEDILKGYTRENHIENNSSLSESCMNNKHSYLELYTKNSNVELAILYYESKIIARCLVWNINGVKKHDKIYSNHDWTSLRLKEDLKKLNIEKFDSSNHYTVNIEYIPEYYPYLDTLRWLNLKNKTLSNVRKNTDELSLRSQHGEFS